MNNYMHAKVIIVVFMQVGGENVGVEDVGGEDMGKGTRGRG